MLKVFEGTYTEDKMYDDLTDDIFIVFTDSDLPEGPLGLKSGVFKVIVEKVE